MEISKELQKLIDNNEWLEISRYQKLSEAFIEKFQDKVDWSEISCNQQLSEAFIEKFQDKVSWYEISCNQHLSEAFIEKFKNKVNWYGISCNQHLSEAFIEKFQDKVDWYWISCNQKLSEAFIEKFQDKVRWYWISRNQHLSEAFIEKFQDKVNWDCISRYQHLSPAFSKKHLTEAQQATQKKKHAKKTLAKKREEMAKYAEKWKLKFDGKFLYAFREHDKFGRGAFNKTISYNKGKKYQDWHCDMDEKEENSFGLGIWPTGNTPVKVAVEDWGCAVTHKGESFKKGRVLAFTVLK